MYENRFIYIFSSSEIPVDDSIYGDSRMTSWHSRHRIPCPDFTHMDLRHTKGESEIPVSFVIRMKCILAKRSAGLVSNSFKVSKNNFISQKKNKMFLRRHIVMLYTDTGISFGK